jgi:hypothetical protein
LSSSSNVGFGRLSHSTPWTPISVLGTSTCTSVISWPDFPKTQDKVEQIQFTKFPQNTIQSQSLYSPQLPHPPVLAQPQFFNSSLQGERFIQPQCSPLYTHHLPTYIKQYIPVYGPRLTVPELPIVSEPSLEHPELALNSMALQHQYQPPPSEHMDIDHTRQPISEPLQTSQAGEQRVSLDLDSFPPTYASYHPPVIQDQFSPKQFSDVQQSQFSSCAPGFSSIHCPFPFSPPVGEHISAPLAASYQEAHSVPLPQPVVTASVSQPHANQPLRDQNATETPPPYSEYSEYTTRGVMPDTGSVWQSAEYAPANPSDENIRPSVTAPTSSPHQQPESTPRPSSPADSVRAIGEMSMSVISPNKTDAKID